MACKIAVLRKDTHRKRIGDCVEAFDIDVYLGSAVEPVGGYYVIIEINYCNKDHADIQKLTSDWMVKNPDYIDGIGEEYIHHPEFDREFYLQPVYEGDPFFTELLTTGRIKVNLSKVREYIRSRNG